MIDNKFTRVLTIAMCLVVMLFATSASAVPVTWNESGDAGNTPGTAQTPIGSGQLDIIIGTLSPATDTDVFRIYIPNPDIFALNMIGTSLTPYEALGNDTEVYVLDEAGNGSSITTTAVQVVWRVLTPAH